MTVRWGIAGTGNIANAFAETLNGMGAPIEAVGSRDASRADAFAGRHVIPKAFASYQALADWPDVDVVYVATPASHHYRHAMMALLAGKHVLVEKPFTVNEDQAHNLAATASAVGVFLMEAAWQRFLPSYIALRQLLIAHAVGEVRMVQAAFGGRAVYRPDLRPFRNDLAGGALMDGGVYALHLAHMTLGEPSRVAGMATMSDGIDGQNTVILGYGSGALAVTESAITTTLDASARIYGTDGMIQLPANFTDPAYLEVVKPDGSERIDVPHLTDRLAPQVEEAHRCLDVGRTESPFMPPSESCAIMRTMDQARKAMGLTFPAEAEAL